MKTVGLGVKYLGGSGILWIIMEDNRVLGGQILVSRGQYAALREIHETGFVVAVRSDCWKCPMKGF